MRVMQPLSTKGGKPLGQPCGRRSTSQSVSARFVAKAATDSGTVTNEQIADNPWAQPGWRGAFVSSQPEAVQSAIVAGVTAFGALATYYSATTLGPWICDNLPLMDTYMQRVPFIMGPMFAAAGVAHFTEHKMFCSFYPHQGAWGFWYLPGSPSFHVNWTGVAEIAGGLGIALGALHLPFLPAWLEGASAAGLCLLTVVVSPSNMYMWTHNAPGPLSEEDLDKMGGAIPLGGHMFRAALQVVLMATYWGVAAQNL